MKIQKPLTARRIRNYWRNVDKQPQGCWPWTGCLNPAGTGSVGVDIQGVRINTAHRLAWYLAHGEILDRKTILVHTCGNKLCQNPEHLSKSTYNDRLSYDWINTQPEPARVSHDRRAMTPAEAQYIRDLREQENRTLMEIVRITGRTYKTVNYVVNYKSHNGARKGPKGPRPKPKNQE